MRFISKSVAKLGIFLQTAKFSGSYLYIESYIRAVIEGVVAWCEALCGPEFTDVQRVVTFLLLQTLLALGEGMTEKWIAVAGQHNLPRAEVEGDGDNLALGDGEAIDDGIGDVLIVHLLEHLRDNRLPGYVVGQDIVGTLTFGEELAHFLGPSVGQHLFIGLGIVVKFTPHQTLAIAHEPDFAAQATVDDCRGCHALLGVLLQADHYIGLMASPEGDVMSADRGSHADTELMTGGVGRHLADMAGDGQHGIAPVAHAGVMSAAGLRCGAVDDCDEIICDNDSVLAFPGGILWCEALLDDLHA